MDQNFFKLITQLWSLHRSRFRGQVVVNFDGKTVKDLTTTTHHKLEEIVPIEEMTNQILAIAKALVKP